jgi:hypothetical protein
VPVALVEPVKVDVHVNVSPFADSMVEPVAENLVLGGLSLKAFAWVARPMVATLTAVRAVMAVMVFIAFLPLRWVSDICDAVGWSDCFPQPCWPLHDDGWG